MQLSTGIDYTSQSFELTNLSEPMYSPTLRTTLSDGSMLSYCVGIKSIVYNKQELCLTVPIIAIVGYDGNCYSMENKELGILTMARDSDQCYQDFIDEILFILKEYGEEDDDKLTVSAQALKRKILRYLK